MPQLNKPINVLIVDDFQVITDGVAEMLKDDPAIKIVGKALEKDILFHHLRNKAKVDLILMDIEMPKFKFIGIEMTKEVKQKFPWVKVIILTQHNKLGMLNHALQNGADGFLLKGNASKHYLSKAIKNVFYKNQLIIDPEVKKGTVPEPSLLTKREKQVACLLVEGLSEKEISMKLGPTYNTIRGYTKEIKNKLGVNKNAQIIKYMNDNRLCEKAN